MNPIVGFLMSVILVAVGIWLYGFISAAAHDIIMYIRIKREIKKAKDKGIDIYITEVDKGGK